MAERIQVLDITPGRLCRAPLCGIKDPEHEGRRAKERWLRTALRKGPKARVLPTEKGVQFGYVESVPGELLADHRISARRFDVLMDRALSRRAS